MSIQHTQHRTYRTLPINDLAELAAKYEDKWPEILYARGGSRVDPEQVTTGDLGEASESARDHEGDPAAYAWSAERNSTRSSKGSITPATS